MKYFLAQNEVPESSSWPQTRPQNTSRGLVPHHRVLVLPFPASDEAALLGLGKHFLASEDSDEAMKHFLAVDEAVKYFPVSNEARKHFGGLIPHHGVLVLPSLLRGDGVLLGLGAGGDLE